MATFKLKEAIAYAKERQSIKKSELAKELWGNSTLFGARANFSNLINGRSQRIDISFVPVLCERLGVSADFLFGLTPFPNNEEKKERIKEIVTHIDEVANDLEEIEQTL